MRTDFYTAPAKTATPYAAKVTVRTRMRTGPLGEVGPGTCGTVTGRPRVRKDNGKRRMDGYCEFEIGNGGSTVYMPEANLLRL
jgi:hypothetical protein